MLAAQVERLLKLGAYDVFREGEEGDKASKAFCEEVRVCCVLCAGAGCPQVVQACPLIGVAVGCVWGWL